MNPYAQLLSSGRTGQIDEFLRQTDEAAGRDVWRHTEDDPGQQDQFWSGVKSPEQLMVEAIADRIYNNLALFNPYRSDSGFSVNPTNTGGVVAEDEISKIRMNQMLGNLALANPFREGSGWPGTLQTLPQVPSIVGSWF